VYNVVSRDHAANAVSATAAVRRRTQLNYFWFWCHVLICAFDIENAH